MLSHFPEIPDDTAPIKLTRPLILFAVIRAVAVAIAIAIAYGLHLPNADWMPIATLVAIKPSLDQSTLFAEQRLAGAIIGAATAALFLLTMDNKHVLEVASSSSCERPTRGRSTTVGYVLERARTSSGHPEGPDGRLLFTGSGS